MFIAALRSSKSVAAKSHGAIDAQVIKANEDPHETPRSVAIHESIESCETSQPMTKDVHVR